MFDANLENVFPLTVLVVQAIAIVDFNFNGNPKSDAQVCCMVEYNFPREPFVACFEMVVKTPDQQIDNATIICIHQCYYDAIGMFTGGKPMADKYRQYRDTLEPDLREAFSWAMQFCATFVAKAIESAAELRGFRCNAFPYLYNRCLSEAGIVNCPPSRLMNASLCTALVQKLKEKYGNHIQLSPTASSTRDE